MRSGILMTCCLLAALSGTRVYADEPSTQPESQVQELNDLMVRQVNDEGRMNDLIAQMQAVTGRIDVSPDSLHAAAAKMDDQWEDLTMQDVADQARIKAITATIARLGDEATAAADSDSVVVELEKIVAVQQHALDQESERVKTGIVATADVDTATANLAEAQAQVALHRQEASAAAGGDTVAALKKELVDLAISQAERSAEMELLSQRREGMKKAMTLLEQVTTLQSEEQSVQQTIDRLEIKLGN